MLRKQCWEMGQTEAGKSRERGGMQGRCGSRRTGSHRQGHAAELRHRCSCRKYQCCRILSLQGSRFGPDSALRKSCQPGSPTHLIPCLGLLVPRCSAAVPQPSLSCRRTAMRCRGYDTLKPAGSPPRESTLLYCGQGVILHNPFSGMPRPNLSSGCQPTGFTFQFQ